MFRQQQNVFEDVIAKATDENLTSENWEYMMDAWEKINESPENGPKNAVAAMIKRLAHRNANVQLYTLELANAFSQNCGPKMHRELASRSFTDAMLRLAGDRNTHPTVKAKILERMAEWSEMFAKEPDLGIMEGAYTKLKSQNPNLQPPSKPHKREITDTDRQKEEEELQMALAISLKDRPSGGQISSSKAPQQAEGSGRGVQQSHVPAGPAEVAPHTTAATVSRVRALFDFVPTENGELAFKKGDIIAVLESVYKDWWKGSLRGQTGIFPLNYVEKLSDPTQEEVMKEAQMEAEVFAEIKNVEKLLALLSTSSMESNVQENEEITTLYHQTLAIRPKLIELIGKYSQKKDDFMALNEKFIKARRDYESLLETSMSQSASHYGRPYNYGGDPYQPAGGEPSRYYTPAPQMNPSASPSLQHGAFSPPPQQSGLPYSPGGGRRTSNNFYSPADSHDSGPPPPHGAPFYVVGQAPPGTQLPGGPQGVNPNQRPQSSHPPTNPSGHSDGQTQPQELATSVYDSPLDGRPPHGSVFNPNPQSTSIPAQEMLPSPSQPPGQPSYNAYQGYPPQQPPSSTGPVYAEAAASNGPHPYPVLQSASPLGAGSTAQQTYATPNGGGRPPQNYYTQQHEPPAPIHNAPPPPQQGGAPPHEYTASFAFFEALWEAGVTHCFVNLGSDHPSILEAMVKGQRETPDKFPKIITCPNEMVALSAAHGFAQVTGRPQAVIVHVDVGTQGLGAAVHNASCGRIPVLIFAGLSPFTQEGEMRGSRTEFIHYIQDVPDQRAIVAQYCRYTAEIKTGKNIKQMINRALSFAMSDPKGPVYLTAAREVLEEEIEPYHLDQSVWDPIGPTALSEDAVERLADAFLEAKEPLILTGYAGRTQNATRELIKLCDSLSGIRVLDTLGSDMCFPANHPASLGLAYGVHEHIKTADMILVIDCDVPWIPTQCKPSPTAKIYHIDIDPLKQQMPLFYISARARYRADAFTALKQINARIANSPKLQQIDVASRLTTLKIEHKQRMTEIEKLANPRGDGMVTTAYLTKRLKDTMPKDSVVILEAVTQTVAVANQLHPSEPGCIYNSGAGGLGWFGGAALGAKLGLDNGKPGSGKFVAAIVGDGTFLFAVPASVYWISRRYRIPFLTIVLNNDGWHAPLRSAKLVHPDGYAASATNEELNISFRPSPDYAGIAKAAAGGEVWAGTAHNIEELEKLLVEAVNVVKDGMSAVLDVHIVH